MTVIRNRMPTPLGSTARVVAATGYAASCTPTLWYFPMWWLSKQRLRSQPCRAESCPWVQQSQAGEEVGRPDRARDGQEAVPSGRQHFSDGERQGRPSLALLGPDGLSGTAGSPTGSIAAGPATGGFHSPPRPRFGRDPTRAGENQGRE